MKRLAAARLWHEGNSFCPDATTLDDFHEREWVIGGAAIDHYRGTATEMGAVVEFLDGNTIWQGTILRCAAASPSGPLPAADFAAIKDEIVAGLADGPWDAVYLSLHGALLADGVASADTALLRAVRAAIGDVPLGVSFDLHANLDPAVVDLVDVACGYKTHPHTDMDATGAKTLRLLTAVTEGAFDPVGAIEKTGVVLPSFNMRTADGPMAETVALAARIEAERGLLDVSTFGGFAYGDVAHGGASVLAFADGDAEQARRAVREVAAALVARRTRFDVSLPTAAEGIAAARAAPPGLVAVLDPGDNTLSGGVGDTPGLFRAMIEARPEGPAVFAFFHDPGIVEAAHQAGIGATIDAVLGGRKTAIYGPPVEASAKVARLTDGRFVNHGPMETNLAVELGRSAVLEVDGIAVIVTERCRAPNDPAYFELHGINLATTRLLCVKGKNHFRAAFAAQCAALIEVDAPGPACLDLGQLPFRLAPGLA